MLKIQQFIIINDLSIFGLLILFFIGFLAYDYEVPAIKEPFIQMPTDYKVFFEFLPWVLLLLLIIDLYLKYQLSEGNPKYFLKKYWTDILLTILLPILFPLKYFKVTLKIYKYSKFAKSGFKLIQKYDKIFRSKK
jgi:hypothetical protein